MALGQGFIRQPTNYIQDSDAFTPPTMGGAVAAKYGTFTYEDIASKTLFTLPAGAVLLDWLLDVGVDFNAGTNNNIDLGIEGDADYLAADLAIGTQGLFRNGAANSIRGRAGVRFDSDTPMTVIYKPSGTAASTGTATVIVFYMTRGA